MSDSHIARREALSSRVERLRRMVEIRQTEEQIQALFAEGLVNGSTHTCQGQEAVSVALASVTRPTDAVTCTYRGHGHALALGLTPVEVIGEVLGRRVGSIGGVGGSMHLSEPTVGLLPTFAIVGAGIPVAVGAAIGKRASGGDAIAVGVFGDGATNIGAFHEALNLASVWEVPVVFICENNLYGEYSRIDSTTPFEDLYRRGAAYGIESRAVDGQDIDSLVEALAEDVEAARRTSTPRFVEVKTYRFVGHSRSDTAPYRTPGELDEWLQRDPISLLSNRLVAEGELSAVDVKTMSDGVAATIRAALEEAKAASAPALEAMFAHVTQETGS
jgi:TPP-dependent pyruvate/acetoin dehydrogenase alpha subunit